jgi:N-dimethylarginine dimethylaminohydrolase
MSPPPPGWRIQGGENYKSRDRPAINPRRALQEWLELADAVEAAGGEVAVLEPPAAQLLTGFMYTANAGWLRAVSPVPRFRLSNLSVPHRKAEGAVVRHVLSGLGWEIEASEATWEGQADICSLPPGTREAPVILTYGVRSTRASVDEVAAALPAGQSFHASKLRQPFFHGDTCMDPLPAPKGPVWLAFPGAFASEQEYQAARRFASGSAEVLEITESDALAYACNGLPIGEELLLPKGLSRALVEELSSFGYRVRELDFGELFGKGGGGPRCLVNQLRGLERGPSPMSYRARRTELKDRVATYAINS